MPQQDLTDGFGTAHVWSANILRFKLTFKVLNSFMYYSFTWKNILVQTMFAQPRTGSTAAYALIFLTYDYFEVNLKVKNVD